MKKFLMIHFKKNKTGVILSICSLGTVKSKPNTLNKILQCLKSFIFPGNKGFLHLALFLFHGCSKTFTEIIVIKRILGRDSPEHTPFYAFDLVKLISIRRKIRQKMTQITAQLAWQKLHVLRLHAEMAQVFHIVKTDNR